MLNVGDAVLTFLGDTSQLDQVFARVPAQAAESMGAAAASVDQVGEAFAGVNFELDATASNVPYCGETIKDAMDKGAGSTREAQGEVMLLGELFGIHLPRHVSRFVAGLDLIGPALQGAFAATAVIFLVEALVKGIEKIQEWANAGEKVKEAMDAWDASQQKVFNNLEDGVSRSQIRLDELTGKYLEALKLKLQLIDHQTLDHLDSELAKLGDEAQKVLGLLDRNWFEKTFLGMEGSTEAQAKLKELQKTVSEALSTRTPEAYKQALADVATETDAITKKLAELDAQQKQHDQDLKTALGARAKITEAPDPKDIQAWEMLGKAVQGYAHDIKAAQQDAANLKTADTDAEAKREEAVHEAAAKKQEQLFFEIAKAHAALTKEMEKNVDDFSKIQSERLSQEQKTLEAAVAAELKATTAAEAQRLKQADATAKAEMAQIASTYHEREEAVKQLASMQVISEQQKDRQLLSLYQQEETQTLAILRDQMAKEKAIVDEAQKREAAAKDNPIFSEAQVAELKKNLATAELAYEKTQTEVTKLEDKFDKERLAIQKGAVGQAIALATAAGNTQLALDLKQHQSAMIAIQDQIALAKARGQDVAAMKQQETEIANQTKALVAQAIQINKLKQAWDIFSADFQKSAKTDETSAQQMAKSFETAASGMETAIQSAFAAMVTGSETAGQAIEKAVFSTIAKIAEQWGAYYLARAIADVFDNPAAAAGEFAAGAALEALGGALGALGSASSGAKASASSSTAAITQNASTVAAGPGPSSPNVPRLFSGAIVTQPTYAMIGDRDGGGSQTEGVFPLNDPRARQALMDAFGLGGGGVTHNYNIQGMISTTDLTRLTRVISRGANTGRVRMSVTNSNRVTRRT